MLTRGGNLTEMTSKYDARDNPAVVRNYGTLLVDMCAVVPDGLNTFFVSFECLEKYVDAWAAQVCAY